MEAFLVNIEEVKPNPDNPRTIKDGKFKKLVKSIQEFPEMLKIRPIVVNGEMITLGGNMRLKACKEAGLKQVWIVKADKLTPEQEKEFVIKDNSGYGEWDWEALKSDWDFTLLTDWGIDIPDIVKKEKKAEEDGYEVPALITPNTKKGDLILIGPHRLVCGSAIDSKDMDLCMAGTKADMVHTDPPYNVAYEGASVERRKIENDSMESSAFSEFMTFFYKEMSSRLKPGGPFYIWHVEKEPSFMTSLLEVRDLKYTEHLMWVKNHFVLGRHDYHHQYEPCIYGWKLGAAHQWYGDRKQINIWDQGIPDFDKMSKKELLEMVKELVEVRPNTDVIRVDKPHRSLDHPTMKPITLCGYLIGNSSKEGDVILDQFLGSGSTMVAAHQMGRVCYGTELDPIYCDVIIDRMRQLDPSLVIKRNGKII